MRDEFQMEEIPRILLLWTFWSTAMVSEGLVDLRREAEMNLNFMKKT